MWVFLSQYLCNPVYIRLYSQPPATWVLLLHFSFPSHQKSEHFWCRQSLRELLFTAGEGKGKLGKEKKKKKQETKRTKGSSGRGSCYHRLVEELLLQSAVDFVFVAVNPVTPCLFRPVSLAQLSNSACSYLSILLAKASVMEMKLFAQSQTNAEGRNSS